jgi:hypothetical protein
MMTEFVEMIEQFIMKGGKVEGPGIWGEFSIPHLYPVLHSSLRMVLYNRQGANHSSC